MTTNATKMLQLDHRLRELVEANTHKTRRNLDLEEITNISATQWASWWAGRAKPSSEMLMMICTKWPEFTLWLLTGITDPVGGQIAPSTPIDRQHTTATRYLRRTAEIMDLKNPETGYDLWEHEVDELNALSTVRLKELERRVQTTIELNDRDLDESLCAIDTAQHERWTVALLERLHSGWTFNDNLRAMFVSLHSSQAEKTVAIQALQIGIRAFNDKTTLTEAFNSLKSELQASGASTADLTVLEDAKALLESK